MAEVVKIRDLTCLAGNNALLSNIDWTVQKVSIGWYLA